MAVSLWLALSHLPTQWSDRPESSSLGSRVRRWLNAIVLGLIFPIEFGVVAIEIDWLSKNLGGGHLSRDLQNVSIGDKQVRFFADLDRTDSIRYPQHFGS